MSQAASHAARRAAVALAVAVGLLVLAGGCATRPGIDVNGGVRVDQPIQVRLEGLVVPYEGTYVPPGVFEQVNEGDSPEYIAAILGKPDFEAVLGDGTTVWRWKYRPVAQQASVFSLFGTGKKDEPSPDHVTAFVLIKDNKLVRKWRGS